MFLRKHVVSLCILVAPLAVAQSSAPANQPAAADAKPLAFDVVSIKPSQPGENWHFGFGPTGYSAAGVSLGVMILQAYFDFNMGGNQRGNNISATWHFSFVPPAIMEIGVERASY
jgi:hypothetical protein